MLHLVSHPIIAARLSRLREATTPSTEFRHALHDVGRLMAFEVSRDLETRETTVTTPLTSTTGHILSRPIVLVPILRAGLGLLHGLLDILPEAEVGHLGMARDETTLRPTHYYKNLPSSISSADTMLIDPMLATGHSASAAIAELKSAGASRIRFICLVAAPEGLALLASDHPEVPIYAAALDSSLDHRGYIVPGLGDAGDRYFGTV